MDGNNYNYQLDLNHLTDTQRKVYDQVAILYGQTSKKISLWLWEHHVKVVAFFALELAKKYSADADVCFSAALLHDIADIWMERDDHDFTKKTKQITESVLKNAGFPQDIWSTIFAKIIEPHSCKTAYMPDSLEAKILATADAMAHLCTNFYLDFQEMGLPTENPQDYKEWVLEKLNRDYGRKIFFEDEKTLVEQRYLELKKIFE